MPSIDAIMCPNFIYYIYIYIYIYYITIDHKLWPHAVTDRQTHTPTKLYIIWFTCVYVCMSVCLSVTAWGRSF